MAGRLDSLYQEKAKNLSYQELDALVAQYQHAQAKTDKDQHTAALVRSFHNYFMKYVYLLKAKQANIWNIDTRQFFSLYTNNYREYGSIHRYIVRTCKYIDEEDIYDELCAIFLKCLHRYKVYEGTSFARYITKHMRWYIKLWLRRTANNPLTSQFSSLSDAAVQQEIDNGDPSALLDIVESQESRIVLPYLNLAWVVSPSCRAFRSLTVYERFLLYLKYRENLKLREISKRLGRDKMVILAHLNMALTKLRDTWDKEGD